MLLGRSILKLKRAIIAVFMLILTASAVILAPAAGKDKKNDESGTMRT